MGIVLNVYKTELESGTPKWVFSRGGGFHPPPEHPGIQYAGTDRVNAFNLGPI